MTRRADADRLATLLEADRTDAPASDPTTAPAGEDRQLTMLANALRQAAPQPAAMRPDVKAELRAQVLQAARDQRAEAPFLTRLRDGVQRMRYSAGFATGTGVAAMTLSMGGVAGAAELAQPGDLLYGIKVQIEDVRLATTFDDVARGQRAVSYAFDRLEEARAAAEDGRDTEAALALDGATERMADGSAHLLAAGLVDPLVTLSADVAEQQQLLAALEPLLGDAGRSAAAALSATLQDTVEALAGSLPLDPMAPDAPGTAPTVVIPELTATPLPGIGAPSATPVPVPTAGPQDPGTLPGPTVTAPPAPDLPLPDLPLPDLPTPDLPIPALPDVTVPSVPSGSVSPSASIVPDVLDSAGQAVDGVVDSVTDQVQTIVPPPLSPVVPALVEDATSAADTLSDTLGTVGDVVDDVTDGGLSGLLGGS